MANYTNQLIKKYLKLFTYIITAVVHIENVIWWRVVLIDTLLAAYDRECYSEHPFHEREDNIQQRRRMREKKKIKKKK